MLRVVVAAMVVLILGALGSAAPAVGGLAAAQPGAPRAVSAPSPSPGGSALATPRRRNPCTGVTCGGHGACIDEVEDAFCFCDEGYAASGTTCVPAPPTAAVVTASSVGLTIVQIAVAEDGHDLASVGAARALAPGPLRQYVRAGGLWCSDFVSWVYRAAGVPFTSGYEGGWMLPNNVAIQRWFQRQGAWVARGTQGFGTFQPRPGDYVRIDTPTWSHSAIVRYVEGDILYAVEGNAGGYVHVTTHRRWRADTRIEGFGLVTLAAARQRALQLARASDGTQ